MADNQNT